MTEQTTLTSGRGQAADHLALLLWRVARNHPLPVVEALAVTAVNRRRRVAAHRRGGRLAGMTDDCYFQLCRRVARRALHGALRDRTGGAARCHHQGRNPRWSVDHIPCAEIGAYLFYRAAPAEGDSSGDRQEGRKPGWNLR